MTHVVTLAPQFTIGGPRSDAYEVRWSRNATHDAVAADAAFSWLSAHDQSRPEPTIVLQRGEQAWWVITIEARRGFASGKRPGCAVIGALVPDDIAKRDMPGVLAAVEPVRGELWGGPVNIAPIDDNSPISEGFVERFTTWLVEDEKLFECATFAEASAALGDGAKLDETSNVSFLVFGAAVRLPPTVGRGLRVLARPSPSGRDAQAPLDAVERIRPFWALRALAPDLERRRALARWVCEAGEGGSPPTPLLDRAEVEWTIEAGVEPDLAWSAARLEAIQQALLEGRAGRDALRHAPSEVRAVLRREALLAPFSACTPGDLAAFVELFGLDHPGVGDLVPASLHRAWSRLAALDRAEPLVGADEVELAALLEEAELWPSFPPSAAASARLADPPLVSDRLWAEVLRREIGPAADLFLNPASDGEVSDPLPAPDPSWLPGISLETILALLPRLSPDRAVFDSWCAWWRAHRETAGREPWETGRLRHGLAWLAAAARTGVEPIDQIRRRFVTLAVRAAPDEEDELRAAITSVFGEAFGHLVDPFPGEPEIEPLEKALEASEAQEMLYLLVKRGMIPRTTLIALYAEVNHTLLKDDANALLKLFRGERPPRSVEELSRQGGAFLIADGSARTEQADAIDLARRILERVGERKAFWSRWKGDLGDDLTRLLGALSASGTPRAVADAVTHGSALSLAALQLAVCALSRRALLRQCVAWRASHDTARDKALGIVLKAPALQEDRELTAWLETLLRSFSPLGSPPPLSHEDMEALLPLLDLERDVLRPLVSDTTVTEESIPPSLADAIVDETRRRRVVFSGRPSTDVLRRWSRLLSRLEQPIVDNGSEAAWSGST
jgi:hypothetical protein